MELESFLAGLVRALVPSLHYTSLPDGALLQGLRTARRDPKGTGRSLISSLSFHTSVSFLCDDGESRMCIAFSSLAETEGMASFFAVSLPFQSPKLSWRLSLVYILKSLALPLCVFFFVFIFSIFLVTRVRPSKKWPTDVAAPF